MKTELKERIKLFFERDGINLAGIADEAGIPRSSLALWIRDERPLSKEYQRRLLTVITLYGFKSRKYGTHTEAGQ